MSAQGTFKVKGNGRIKAPAMHVGNIECGAVFVLLEKFSQHHSKTDVMMKVHVPESYRGNYASPRGTRWSYVVNVTQGKLASFSDDTRVKPIDVEAEVFV